QKLTVRRHYVVNPLIAYVLFEISAFNQVSFQSALKRYFVLSMQEYTVVEQCIHFVIIKDKQAFDDENGGWGNFKDFGFAGRIVECVFFFVYGLAIKERLNIAVKRPSVDSRRQVEIVKFILFAGLRMSRDIVIVL